MIASLIPRLPGTMLIRERRLVAAIRTTTNMKPIWMPNPLYVTQAQAPEKKNIRTWQMQRAVNLDLSFLNPFHVEKNNPSRFDNRPEWKENLSKGILIQKKMILADPQADNTQNIEGIETPLSVARTLAHNRNNPPTNTVTTIFPKRMAGIFE